MTKSWRLALKKLTTGVPGLDEILGGGLPEYSFNLIAGEPGAGKTTLAHQILFANATPDKPALYFTVLGEPSLKMLRYQQQMEFFDPEKLGSSIRFVDLSQVVLEHDLTTVLETIVQQVNEVGPAFVVVDSFRTVIRNSNQASAHSNDGEMALQGFLQRLAMHLATWQATTFLVGEYSEAEMQDSPIFTVADGIVWLYQSCESNVMTRKLRVMKMRGAASLAGMHPFRITREGLRIYPRWLSSATMSQHRALGEKRLSSGIKTLDPCLDGGFRVGTSTLVSGPAGVGKTIFGLHFIAASVKEKESYVVVIFAEHATDYIAQAKKMGMDIAQDIRAGRARVIAIKDFDISIDELLHVIWSAANGIHAKRVLLDSLSNLPLAINPGSREAFGECIYRMIDVFTTMGITVMITNDMACSIGQPIPTTHQPWATMVDNIITLFPTLAGDTIGLGLTISKMRWSPHSRRLHPYTIGDDGITLSRSKPVKKRKTRN